MTTPMSTDSSEDHPPASRRGAARFVGVFVVLVLLQLTAYRYAVDSRANDWYLFNVARHTTWALDIIGHRATLEGNGTRLNPTEVRAIIFGAAQHVPVAGVQDPAPPLSAWERWLYRAHNLRKSASPGQEFGPRVSFVFRPGIHHRLEDLEASRQAMTRDDDAQPEALPALEGAIIDLRKEITKGLHDPEMRKRQQGIHFSFNVVPACGAIEVMAIFLAAVIAFPAPWRSRTWGLLAGLAILYGVNIFRLCCLAVIGAFDSGGDWFTFIHEYVWQAIYVVFVVVVWLAWVEVAVRRRAS